MASTYTKGTFLCGGRSFAVGAGVEFSQVAVTYPDGKDDEVNYASLTFTRPDATTLLVHCTDFVFIGPAA